MTYPKFSPNDPLNEEIINILSSYFSQRGSFLAQVIRADLQSLVNSPLLSSRQENGTKKKKPHPIELNDPPQREVVPSNGIGFQHNLFSVPSIVPQSEVSQPTISEPVQSKPETTPKISLETQLIELVAQKTGFPENSIQLNARLLDDLNLDSIKGGELIADFAKLCHVAGSVDPTTLANASLQEILEAVKEVMPTTATSSQTQPIVDHSPKTEAQNISSLLLNLVAQKTGFPSDSVSLDLRLLDDLNLDSIKTGELVAEAAKSLGIAGQIDPSQFANASLKEITEVLTQHHQPSPSPTVTVATPSPITPSSEVPYREPWVRNFVVEYDAEEAVDIPVDETENWETANLFDYDDWKQAYLLIVAETSEADWVKTLSKTFQNKGSTVETVTYDELSQKELIQNPKYTHFIGILPQKAVGDMESQARLLRAMSRVRAIATPLSAKQVQRNYLTVAYLQFGGGYFGRLPEMSHLEQCGTMGFAASLHLERSDLKVRVIDLPLKKPTRSLSEKVISELGRKEAYIAVGYDNNLTRRVPRPKVQDRTQYTPRSLSWSSDDVMLITGGAKGITAECAIAFARLTGVKTALVGRSPHPQDDPLNGSAQEIARTLRAFNEERLTCRYYQCDVTDATAIKELVTQVQEELGQITGVIHGSALNKPRRVENSTLTEAKAEVAPKILGILNLMEALDATPPKLFVGFSSISAVLGLPGNTWYGFSNESLDLLLRNFGEKHPETSTLAIAFSVWAEVGMGARMGTVRNLNRMGIQAMSTEEGVSRFLQLMFKDPGDSQVVVSAKLGDIETLRRGFDTWRTHRSAPSRAFKFIDKVETFELGVEVISRTHLSLEKDSYVKDHIYQGSYLFPTVFGLEAMAQAALYSLQKTELSQIRLENIRLERPIVVDPHKGVEIEIVAEVLERKSAKEPIKIQAEIRTERTGFLMAHFAATFVLEAKNTEIPVKSLSIPKEPLNIDPKADLYSWLLFQGTRFQRLEKVYDLNSQEFLFSTKVTAANDGIDSPDRADGPFVLGDPYYRDSLLQSVQPPIPQDICLPVRIDGINIYKVPTQGPCFGKAVIEGLEGKEYRTSVTATDEQGQVFEKLEGYQVRILEHKAENPTAEAIVNAHQIDEQRLQQELLAAAAAFGVDSPSVSLAYLPGLQALPTLERRNQEVPLFSKTVGNLLKNPES